MADRESLLETAEELYEEAPCGYVSTRPDGTIVRVNSTFLRWLGRSRDDLIDRSFRHLLPVGGRIYYDTHLLPLLYMQGYVREVAFDLRDATGKPLPLLVNVVQKCDGDDKPYVHRFTMFDATDRRAYERELLAARQRAEVMAEELKRLNDTLEDRVRAEVAERLRVEEALHQAQKMEAIGQLTGGVAHDFNNLLTVIIGSMELLQRSRPDDVDRRSRFIGMTMKAAQSAAALTHRLLAFSRSQPLDPQPIDVEALVADMSEMLGRTLGPAVTLETVLAPGIADSGRSQSIGKRHS